MSLGKRASRLNFDRDLPTTPEDVKALQDNRPQLAAGWLDQLTRLYEQIPNVEEIRWKRRTFEGFEPFEL